LKASIIFYVLIVPLVLVPSHIAGVLTENGTCTNGTTTLGNQTQILNQSADRYFKNLTMDNRAMAEIMCQAMLNETIET
jgi:hypothetical protein